MADLDTGLGVVCRRGAHALLDLAGHGQEGLFDVAGILGGRLEEWDAQAVGELLLLTVSHLRDTQCGSLGRLGV